MSMTAIIGSSRCPCCSGRGTIALDFTQPVPLHSVAFFAGIEPVLLHGVLTRADVGLVDVEAPPGKGRFQWVDGPSAEKYIGKERYLQAVLHPSLFTFASNK